MSSLRRTVSPAPPSNSTLSGTTTAARPSIFSSVLTCWTKLSCLFWSWSRSRRGRPSSALALGSPSSLTIVTLRLLAERRVGEHQVEPLAGVAAQAVVVGRGSALGRRRRRCRAGAGSWRRGGPCRRRAPTPRRASSCRCRFWSWSRLGLLARRCSRARRGGSRRCRRPGRRSSRPAAGRITSTIAWISGRGVKYWPAPALVSCGVLLQQPLVGVALHVGVERRSTVSRSIRSTISRRSLAGSWILFCALRKITPEHARLACRALEDVAVVDLQLVAVLARAGSASRSPPGRCDGSIVRRLRLLVGHLEEEQEGELLDVVAVGQAVVAQDVAVVPELVDDLPACRSRCHYA